jgi:hypothetical protein
MHQYEIYIRDWKTLNLIGEIPVYTELTWTDSAMTPGSFRAHIPACHCDPSFTEINRIIEIRREGSFAFAGILRQRELTNPDFIRDGDQWVLSGPSLLWFASRRTVLPTSGQEFDSVAQNAEPAMLGYVQRHLTNPFLTTRNINQSLTGITFDTQTSLNRGSFVRVNESFVELLSAVLTPIAEQAEFRQWVAIRDGYAGYRYHCSPGTNRTQGQQNAVIFSVESDNLQELSYRQDTHKQVNVVYVLGPGKWDERQVVVRTSTDGDMRSETAISNSNGDTAADLNSEGDAHIKEALEDTVEFTVKPVIAGPYHHYHDLWEVGDRVTITIPRLNITVNKRIIQETVQLTRNGESVSLQLGTPPRVLARVIGKELEETERLAWRTVQRSATA